MHKFSTNFKFDDYKKVGKGDVKNSRIKKKSKCKPIANIKSKVCTQTTSRNNGPQNQNSNTMELEDDEKLSLAEALSPGKNQPPQSFQKRHDTTKHAAEIIDAMESQNISNKTKCDNRHTVTKCKFF